MKVVIFIIFFIYIRGMKILYFFKKTIVFSLKFLAFEICLQVKSFLSFFYIFSYIFFLVNDVWITATDFINLIAAAWSTNDRTAFCDAAIIQCDLHSATWSYVFYEKLTPTLTLIIYESALLLEWVELNMSGDRNPFRSNVVRVATSR